VAELCTYPKTVDISGLKKKTPIKWTDEMQQVFDKMCLLMAADALAAYPDHNKRFDVYTDASDFQLGACIIQEGKPVAYFSCKLTKSQQNYTTMEKEMLSIVATLEEFRSMLLGADIHAFTDPKNLTFNTLKTQRVLCWHTKIEEFLPMLHYIKGPCNILADNLSRLHCLVTPAQITEGKKLVEPAEVSIEEEDKAYFLDQEYSGLYAENIWECIGCYLNLPETPHPDENPLNYAHICELQQQDKELLALQVEYPDNSSPPWSSPQKTNKFNPATEESVFPPKTNDKNCIGTINFISVLLSLLLGIPSPRGHAAYCKHSPFGGGGGGDLAVRQIPHSPSLTNPRQGLSWSSLPPALNIRSLPGERLHWRQTVENEGAIGVMHRSCFRVVAAPTLAMSRTMICRIILDDPPFFLKAKR
jgi:hypothetical protein